MFLKSARAITDAAESAIDSFLPTQVLLLNGLFLFESIIWEICRSKNISVVTYERAFIIDTFVFARDDAAGFYKMNDVWKSWSTQKLSLDEEFDDKQRAKFGFIAIEAREHLERLMAQWEENAKDRKGEDK